MSLPSPAAVSLRILDRYLLAELSGPFFFGLSVFTLIFAATQILAIGRLISDQHAPLAAAVEYFLWQLPRIIVLILPMAMLLGVLLTMQRLSRESEITAFKAGGISLLRVVAPLLVAGLSLSAAAFFLQETIVPIAQERAVYLEQSVIRKMAMYTRDVVEVLPLPGGGRQFMSATGYDGHSATLTNVTLIQYDRESRPTQVIFSDRAQFSATRWKLFEARGYAFAPDGSATSFSLGESTEIHLAEQPSDFLVRVKNFNLQEMSRGEIAQVIAVGQLSPAELRKYVASYHEKLAQPFASFVFTLIALPFGLRSARGEGMGLGFGLAVGIVFIYYIVATVFSYVGDARLEFAIPAAWAPNVLFSLVGGFALLRVAKQ